MLGHPLLADSNSVSSIKNTFANCISLLLDTFTRGGKGLEISEAPRTTSLVVVAKGTLGNERGWNQAFLLCAWPISDVGQQKLKACCPNVVTFIIHFCSSKKLQTSLQHSCIFGVKIQLRHYVHLTNVNYI